MNNQPSNFQSGVKEIEPKIIPVEPLKSSDKNQATTIIGATQLKTAFPAALPAGMQCSSVTSFSGFATQLVSPVYIPAATFSGTFTQPILTSANSLPTGQIFVSSPTAVVLHSNFQCMQGIAANLANPFQTSATDPVNISNAITQPMPMDTVSSTSEVTDSYLESMANAENSTSDDKSVEQMEPYSDSSVASEETGNDPIEIKSVDSNTLPEKEDQLSSESLASEKTEDDENGKDSLEYDEPETVSSTCFSQDVSDLLQFDGIDAEDYNDDGVTAEYNELDFVWEEYLQETGASAVPPTAFKHVECSLQSGFVKGMKLEVPNKSSPGSYWVASVVMTCGPLLRLRYDGYGDDGSADFWCDLSASEIHPIGWCSQNGRHLQPPETIKNKFTDWEEFLMNSLNGVKTVPSYLLDKTTGTTPIDQIKQGMRLELQDEQDLSKVWIVKVIENVGGRLYLRLEGVESATHDFWLFYLNHRLHPIGWTKEQDFLYEPPKEIEYKHSKYEWSQILEEALKDAEIMPLPVDIFKDQIELKNHNFVIGWKLEALNPVTKNQICPATVIEIVNEKYFVVEIDDLQTEEVRTSIQFGCHANSAGIFPAQWCQWKGLRLSHPRGWNKPDFCWPEYLDYCNAKASPEDCFELEIPPFEFERGMKLEAVNPENPNQICAATITKIVGPLMWIHLDNSSKIVASHIEDVNSHNLYPVGWCESNGYQLKPPRKTGMRRPSHKRVAIVQPEPVEGPLSAEDFRADTYNQIKNGITDGNSWCPKIFFNHRCFSGPYLSKGRIAELPKCVGPGLINLVMKEVLSMLINVAYKSCRVLRELQMERTANPNMHQQMLKAKYKGKSYRAVVEICKNNGQLEDFCRQICIKLECCPNLVSPHYVDGNCPENCSQLTKTKYIGESLVSTLAVQIQPKEAYYYGKKKRKIGRPPGGHTNLENGPKKPGKRRKRKKINLMQRKCRPSGYDDIYANSIKPLEPKDNKTGNSTASGEGKKHESKPPIKRKYTHHVLPRSEIRTRGAKLPKYSFERKTHKKILISAPAINSVTKATQQPETPMQAPSSREKMAKKENTLQLESNPLNWSVADVVGFIRTTDCGHLARLFREQEIDGQALLLLTLPTVQEHLDLKLGPAIKLCHHIERVKIAFYETFA